MSLDDGASQHPPTTPSSGRQPPQTPTFTSATSRSTLGIVEIGTVPIHRNRMKDRTLKDAQYKNAADEPMTAHQALDCTRRAGRTMGILL